MGFIVALVVAAIAGFIALSYEILWYRVISYASLRRPQGSCRSQLPPLFSTSSRARWRISSDRPSGSSGSSMSRISYSVLNSRYLLFPWS